MQCTHALWWNVGIVACSLGQERGRIKAMKGAVRAVRPRELPFGRSHYCSSRVEPLVAHDRRIGHKPAEGVTGNADPIRVGPTSCDQHINQVWYLIRGGANNCQKSRFEVGITNQVRHHRREACLEVVIAPLPMADRINPNGEKTRSSKPL